MKARNKKQDKDNLNGYELRREDFQRRILDAAQEIILETGTVSFSAKELADRAGVSLATPYNHFGSKAGVLSNLLRRDLDDLIFESKNTVSSSDGSPNIEELAEGAGQTAQRFVKKSKFYRTLYSAVLSDPSNDAKQMLLHATENWYPAVEQIQSTYNVDVKWSSKAISTALEASWFGYMFQWARGYITGKEFVEGVTLSTELICKGMTEGK